MSIASIVREKLISCAPDTLVCEVAKIMESEDVGAVLILNAGKPIGIVTDRDLTTRCVARCLNVELTTIEEVMTPVVETILETEGIYSAIRAMRNGSIRRIVAVDEAGKATRVISFDDLFSLVAQEINDLKELVQPFDSKIEQTAA